ncbi:MAG: DMT family protein [Candidatus Omnitrophota bacterium]
MHKLVITTLMLAGSNVFMTFAWYGHLKNYNHKPWIVAAIISWGIALFEYLIQVPANRIGHQVLNLGQLKILQEVITLSIFVPFSLFYMKEGLKQDYLWAAVFIMLAAFFMFRGLFVSN